MNLAFWAASLSAAPAAALWLSWPRRPWLAGLVAFLAAALWAAGFVVAPPEAQAPWTLAGAWSLLGALYAYWAAARSVSEYRRLEAQLLERSERKVELRRSVADAKAQGSRTEEEQKEVLALYGMVRGLLEALSWEEVRPKLEAAAQQYLGAEEFALYVADLRSPDTLHPLVVRRLGASPGASWDTLSRFCQERGLTPTAAHAIESPERAVAVPIRESDEMMGYLYARVPVGVDAQALLRKASAFSEEIAFAFRRVKLFQELERLSQIDGLTGVFRRGVLDERLREEAVRARSFKTSFCLMLLDIDHFKRLNDAYGHPFGDQVLRRLGEILKASVYETDFVARYGGEEFAVLLPRADPAGVLRKAEAVRQAVEREPFALAMQRVQVSVSIGVAHFPRDGSTPEAVVHRADQALYQAKEKGRNRVVDIIDVPVRKTHG